MVELERLRFGYGREALFRDMDLSLSPGAIHGLVGLNGAGKSTLLRLVAGLLFPAAGRVRVPRPRALPPRARIPVADLRVSPKS